VVHKPAPLVATTDPALGRVQRYGLVRTGRRAEAIHGSRHRHQWCEVAVGNRDRVLAASNAAGGAFEGATVSCGTGAIKGAIKNISIEDGRIHYETLGGRPPVGIYGSGLIDLLAEMLRDGIIDHSGRFSESFRETNEFIVSQEGKGINPLEESGRPTDHIELSAKKGLGISDLKKIKVQKIKLG